MVDLSTRLSAARRERQSLLKAGKDTASIDAEMLALRRELRAGRPLSAGDALDGDRYELLERVGQGGFGVVWKAMDTREDRIVAVKVLLGEHAADRSRVERFFRGAEQMGRLRHPGIVGVPQARGEEDGLRYFVMDYIEGEDLEKAVLGGRVKPDQVIPIVCEIAEALHHAHEKGLVHRDVTPSNVLLDRGRPLLTDFDLVRAQDTTGGTRTGAMGKWLYAAPEVLDRPQEADRRADVYSLGMTTVFALSGKALRQDVIRRTERYLQGLTCSEAVRAVLAKAISAEPEDRHGTVTEFAAALRAAATEPGPPPAPAKFAPGVPASLPAAYPSDLAPLQTLTFEVVQVDERGQIVGRQQRTARGWLEDLAGVSLAMVLIRGGAFQMGSRNSQGGHQDERPQHRVDVPTFAVGRVPVTQEQWEAVASLSEVSRKLERRPATFMGAKRPVESIDWDAAVEFCARLSRRTGRLYRLPSEAEWEYAARAGTETPFHYGATITPGLANYGDNGLHGEAKTGEYRRKTAPVATVGFPNGFGLWDVHGNVWEWCLDAWHDSYVGAPTDGSAWGGPEGSRRVVRGGSWRAPATYCRSAFRRRYGAAGRSRTVGFRVVCAVARTRP